MAAIEFTPTQAGTASGNLPLGTAGGVYFLALSGTGERSLVTHFYRSILGRVPDAAGKAFWDGEAARMTSLGANINETWFVMSGFFFNSPEYLARSTSDAVFVVDLYRTFFNRSADTAGQAYWTEQLRAGLPRQVVLTSFLFSSEFVGFTQAIFGNAAARPEVDMVMDMYRGFLGRLPDTESFNYWRTNLRFAQCQGATAVRAAVRATSQSFLTSSEYAQRNRTATQVVADMYYAFLRRGGDLQGVQAWIDELASGRQSASMVRDSFIASPEFAARIQAVVDAGCYTGP